MPEFLKDFMKEQHAWAEPEVGDEFYYVQWGTPIVKKVTKVLNSRVILEDGTYINLKSRTHSEKKVYQPVTPEVRDQWNEAAKASNAVVDLKNTISLAEKALIRVAYGINSKSAQECQTLQGKIEAFLKSLEG